MAKEQAQAKNEPQVRRDPVKDFFKDLAFVLVAFFFLNSFVLASFEVPTGSMENEIMTGDFLFVNKYLYGGSTPRTIPFTNVRIPWFRLPAFRHVERGDVIVFEFPGQRDEVQSPEFMFYLKRAMALEGDTIQVVNRRVYVNGKAAPIPRNMKFNGFHIRPAGDPDPRIFPKGAPYNEDNWGPTVVPRKGEVITLTHENLEQWDTFIEREGHTVTTDPRGAILIDGKPSSTYVVERNYLFAMGDNRDNSLDGRFWGFVPDENLIGTPMIVYWSWDPDKPIVDLSSLKAFFTGFAVKFESIRFNRIFTLIK